MWIRDTADAHVFGKSTANQRIEGWWSYLRRNRTNWWINYFKDLVEKDIYHPGDELEDEALWYCFSQLLQNDLDVVKEHWNTHRIRQSRHETIPGRPDVLYFFPQNHGGNANLLSEVPGEKLQYVTDNVLTSPDEDNISQEYFDYILDSSELEHPTGWKDAEDLYTKLIEIAQPVQNWEHILYVSVKHAVICRGVAWNGVMSLLFVIFCNLSFCSILLFLATEL